MSIPLFWFPLVKKNIEILFSISSELVLILDRTQWQNTNILMISLAWKKRAIPLYWKILTHKGAGNLTEKKAVIRPVIRLLKDRKIMIIADREFHKIMITGDREFHSIFLSHWLKKYHKLIAGYLGAGT